MKKFTLFLLLCMAALCLPQDVLADDVTVTVEGEKATITSSVAGALKNSSSNLAELVGCTELVFVGSFSGEDLQAAAQQTTTVTKVDMTEAKFPAIEAQGSDFYLSHDVSGLSGLLTTLDRAIVGGTVYELTTESHSGWGGLTDYTSDGTEVEYASEAAMLADIYIANGTIGKYQTGTAYIQLIDNNGTKEWGTVQYTEPENVTITPATYNNSDVPYDRHNETEVINSLNAGSWYSFKTYAYAQKSNYTSNTWNPIEYVDGNTKTGLSLQGVFSTVSDMEDALYNSTSGTKAIVLGTRYKYDTGTSSWIVTTGYQADKYDWSQMKFNYWSSSLQEAITSKHVLWENGYSYNEATRTVTNGLPSDIFAGCTELTKVTYLSGNAIGFQDKKAEGGYKLDEVVFGDSVTWISDGAFQRATLTKFSFTNPCNTSPDLIIDNGAFAEATNAEIVGKFPNRLKKIGHRAFYAAKVGKFEVCETEGLSKLTELSGTAFGSSKVSEIVVPLSVTAIKENAFQSTNNLSKITFLKEIEGTNITSNAPLLIEGSSFSGGDEGSTPVLNVYLMFEPTERRIMCEYDAFNYTQMQGQTDTGNKKFGKLNFPDTDTAWDYYQGNWKKGLAFRQESLNAFKDGYNDNDNGYYGKSSGTINTSTGKYEYSGEGQYTPANGWQQFSITNTDIDIKIPSGAFLRSYSSEKSFRVPKFSNNDTNSSLRGKPMMRLFRVTAFSDGWQSGKDVNSSDDAASATRTATAKEVYKYLPANTGLIMVGYTDTSYLVYLDPTTDADTDLKEFPYNTVTYNAESATDSLTNLLYPSCLDNNTTTVTEYGSEVTKVIINPTQPYPIFSVNKNETDNFRIFGFMPANKAFGRPTSGVKIGADMAYLKLPVSLFHWANEKAASGSENIPTPSQSQSKVFLNFDDLDEFSETTGISNIIDSTNENANVEGYFTLQGVKVAQPTQKGIYIHNGKKIMVK